VGAHEFRERFGYWMDRAAAGAELVVTRHGKPTARVIAALRPTPNREASEGRTPTLR
jgi:prevent-host-death family protein